MSGGCSAKAAFGICQVGWRDLNIDVSEIHVGTGEVIMPIDGDIYCHVAPPTDDAQFPADRAEMFRVPQGTMLVLKPGIWHHAPFSTQPGKRVNTLIVLPEYTYRDDCQVRELENPVEVG